jgi:uncharacterized protein with putative carbohydrate binding module
MPESSLSVMIFTIEFMTNDLWRQLLVNGGYYYDEAAQTNHPGLKGIATGTTIGGLATASMRNTGGSSTCTVPGANNYIAEFVFYIEPPLTGGHYGIGMFSDADDVNDTHMSFMEYVQGTDTNWQFITRDGTGEASQTKTDSGVAMSTATWFRLLIVSNITSVDFYIATGNDTYGSAIQHTTDISNTDLCPNFFISTSDTTENFYIMDLMSVTSMSLSR